MNWFTRLFSKPPAPATPAAPAPTPERKAISQADMDRIGPGDGGVDPQAVFRVAEPMPGVLPSGKTAKLAMDEVFGEGFDAMAANASILAGAMPWLGYPVLCELAQRPEYRRISEIIAKQMTRKFLKLTSSGDKAGADMRAERIEQLQNALEHFKVRDLLARMAMYDGLFGRGQLFIDLGGSETENTTTLLVDPKKIKKGALKGFRPVEPFWTYPANYNASDPLSPSFYKPESWYVMGRTIHATRLLTFVSREVPDILKPAYSFGGLSMTQMARPYVDNWLRTRQGVSDLIDAFSVMVLKTRADDFIQGGGADQIIKRVEAFQRFRSNRGLFVLDKDSEEFANVSASIQGLDKLQAQAQEHMASVAGIPLVILFGITPSGLNASADGEIRSFYDWIEAQQESFFGPPVRVIMDVLQLHLFGDIDQSIGYEWVPLWQLDAVQRATVRKSQADTAQIYIDTGVISPAEERERVAREDESDYTHLDLSEDPSDDLEDEDEEGAPDEDGPAGEGEKA